MRSAVAEAHLFCRPPASRCLQREVRVWVGLFYRGVPSRLLHKLFVSVPLGLTKITFLNNAPLVTVLSKANCVPPTIATVPARGSHTDLTVPDFTAYRSGHTENPSNRAPRGEVGKKAAGYMILGGKCSINFDPLH